MIMRLLQQLSVVTTILEKILDKATDTIIEMVKKYEPDIFVAGPAFNAGRYGVACGTICKAVEERLGIPVLSGMYEENPGADMFKQDVILVKTGNSAATMKKMQFHSL